MFIFIEFNLRKSMFQMNLVIVYLYGQLNSANRMSSFSHCGGNLI